MGIGGAGALLAVKKLDVSFDGQGKAPPALSLIHI